MAVILTQSPLDRGLERFTNAQSGQCDCDCDCACPIGTKQIPVLMSPIAFYWELTSSCNNHCPGCGNVFVAPNGIEACDWKTILDSLTPYAQQLNLTGGEPTLHPAFAEIVQTIDQHNIPFTVFTNGRWLDPERLPRLLSSIASCQGLLLSLHGSDAVSYEAFSGVVGSFAEVTNNLERAASLGLAISVSLVINRHNWNRVEETLHLALSLGANGVVCNRLLGHSIPDLTPSLDQLGQAVQTIESLRVAGQPIRFGNCIPQCFAPSSSTGCTAGATFATIDPWGRVRPCNHAPLIAGELRTQSLMEIWQGNVMTHWRNLMPVDCAACPAFATCHGGCRAQALLSGTKQDPLIKRPFPLPKPEIKTRLWAGLQPVAQFASRQESGQMLLIHRTHVAIAPPAFYGLLPCLDGSLTLQQIRLDYGDTAVDWVGNLFQAGLVAWR